MNHRFRVGDAFVSQLADGMNPPKACQPAKLSVSMLAEHKMHLQLGWAMCKDECLIRIDLDVLHNSSSEWHCKPRILRIPQESNFKPLVEF